jgi:hypothetical protein
MNKVDVQLSESGDDAAIFHDLRYTNDREGGNKNEMTFEITNWSGNGIKVETAIYATNKRTQKTELVWETPLESDAIRLTIRGAFENSEFLHMLRLILEAEKMVSIIKP